MEFLCRSAKIEDGLIARFYIEEVELVDSAADAVGEKQDVPFEPGNFLRGVLEACSWSAHCELRARSFKMLVDMVSRSRIVDQKSY